MPDPNLPNPGRPTKQQLAEWRSANEASVFPDSLQRKLFAEIDAQSRDLDAVLKCLAAVVSAWDNWSAFRSMTTDEWTQNKKEFTDSVDDARELLALVVKIKDGAQ
jgi:hypothetical protein